MWPAGHRLPETSCAGRAPHGPSQPPDMPDRDRSTPCRPPGPAPGCPARQPPSRSIPARISDRPASPRRSGPTMRQQPPGNPTSPFGIAARVSPNTPSLPDIRKRRSSARRASRPAACLQPLSRSSPDGPFIVGRPRPILPEVFQQPGSKREREKTPASSLPSFPPPSFSRPHDQTCPFLPAASQRRGPADSPGGSFFGDGESTRGEGAVFTKNAPSPLVIPLLHGLSPTKKAGQSPAPAFTGKTKERGCVTSFRRCA